MKHNGRNKGARRDIVRDKRSKVVDQLSKLVSFSLCSIDWLTKGKAITVAYRKVADGCRQTPPSVYLLCCLDSIYVFISFYRSSSSPVQVARYRVRLYKERERGRCFVFGSGGGEHIIQQKLAPAHPSVTHVQAKCSAAARIRRKHLGTPTASAGEGASIRRRERQK